MPYLLDGLRRFATSCCGLGAHSATKESPSESRTRWPRPEPREDVTSWEGSSNTTNPPVASVIEEEDEPPESRWLHMGDATLPPLVESPVKLAVGTRQLKVLVKPPSPEALWDWYEGRNQQEADPSWAHVWPCSAALAGVVAADPSLVAGFRVAELGAGLGVAGLVAALAGAQKVTLLDREPLALHCALTSATLNGLSVVAFDEPNPATGAVRASMLDWSASANTCSAAVDVALASEVLYDADTALGLASTLVAMLGICSSKSSGRLLLTDPQKERVSGCRSAFVKALEDSGAVVVTKSLPVPALGEGLEKVDPVLLLDARWT